jgi:hypothetical protein
VAHAISVLAITLALVGGLILALRRSRPGLSLGPPVLAALGSRFLAAGVFSSNHSLDELRGPDENTFARVGEALSRKGFFSDAAADRIIGEPHVWLISVQHRIFEDPSDFGLRVVGIGFAVAGIVLAAAAVHDLAGPKAALLVCWVLALDPASLFFAQVLHRDALLYFGAGLTLLAAVRIWKKLDLASLALAVPGLVVAVAARDYAGYFLAIGLLFVALHAAVRGMRRSPLRSAVWLTGVLFVIGSAVPIAGAHSPRQALDRLQVSQDANTSDASNLPLEPVDYSSPSGFITGFPRRIGDLLFRPYPWQLANASQRLGAIETLFVWALIGVCIVLVVRQRWALWHSAMPVAYLLLVTIAAYALSVGNAGTGFRYRTHVVLFLVALSAVLYSREPRRAGQRQEAEETRRHSRDLRERASHQPVSRGLRL